MVIRILPPVGDADRAWLADLWRVEWGGETMVTKGRMHRLADLDALIAWEGDRRIGAATYRLDDGDCELISLNSAVEGRGVGSQLLAAVEAATLETGCQRVWLITTNDNLDALKFYQRRGYRLVAVYPGAVDEARKIKPTIPTVGHHGIPLHDEIELEKRLI